MAPVLSIAYFATFGLVAMLGLETPIAADRASTEWINPVSWSSWFGGHSHLGTGEVKVRVDASRLSKGVLFLDDVDLKTSSTGIIVRRPGIVSLRSAAPGFFHNWQSTEYCKVVVHANQLTVVDVLLTGRAVRNPDGTVSVKPVCKCLIQEHENDNDAVRTCE